MCSLISIMLAVWGVCNLELHEMCISWAETETLQGKRLLKKTVEWVTITSSTKHFIEAKFFIPRDREGMS